MYFLNLAVRIYQLIVQLLHHFRIIWFKGYHNGLVSQSNDYNNYQLVSQNNPICAELATLDTK